METCSCDFLCPCATGFHHQPTKGYCNFALAYQIGSGSYGDVSLDGRSFLVVGRTPTAMASGDWSVGLIVDDKASPEQVDALVKIASGAEGGPMAGLAPLISNFMGVEQHPIEIHVDAMSSSAKAGDLVDEANVGAAGMNESQPMFLENVGHPSNSRLALARATKSHVHAFGIDWDDDSGKNNGHYSPFDWSGGA